MALQDDEFERIQNQLLELKTNKYSLEEDGRRKETEILGLKQKVEELEKELNRSQNLAKLNPLSLARTFANKSNASKEREQINCLTLENERLQGLQRKVESQEEEFKITNQMLRQEISYLMTTNDSLEREIKQSRDAQNNELKPECDLDQTEEGCSRDSEKEEELRVEFHEQGTGTRGASVLPNDPNSQMSFAILAEKEQLEMRVNELLERMEELVKENQLISSQLEEMQEKTKDLNEVKTQLTEATKVAEQRKGLIAEMKAYVDELNVKHETELKDMQSAGEMRCDEINMRFNSLKATADDLSLQLEEMSVVKAKKDMLEAKSKELEEELVLYKEKLSKTEEDNEENLKALRAEKEANIGIMTENYEGELKDLKEMYEECRHRLNEAKDEAQQLRQQINDSVEERKIHEKKGVMMVKELKRQLTSERKRAEKLQEKMQEVLSETSCTSVSMDANAKGNPNGNDASSVGSWSFMSSNREGGGGGTYSQHSGSEGKDPSPGTISPIGENKTEITIELEQENAQLLSRVSLLQQEKWSLEEKINALEVRNAAMAEDIFRKTKIIQFYCMEGRADPHPHPSPLHADKLTVKRVVDFIKDRGDENMKDINRKLQRMLEETLTKNMHLQNDLETISKEVVRLNETTGQLVK